jgi:hypothetical protein
MLQQGACSAKKDHDYRLCQLMGDAVADQVFAFTLNHFSPSGFRSTQVRIEFPFYRVEFTLPGKSAEAKSLLDQAEGAAMASFNAGDIAQTDFWDGHDGGDTVA